MQLTPIDDGVVFLLKEEVISIKKKFAVLPAIIAIVILSSYSLGCGGRFSDDDVLIDKRFEKIIEAIKNQDENTLKSMFSAQASSQSDDFKEQIAHLFEFVQGEIESWKRTGGPGVFEGKNDDGSGRIWKEVRATYDVKTSERTYHISLQEITKHSQNPEKVGVSSFCIIKAEDWGEEYNYWGDLGLPKDFKVLGIIIDESYDNRPSIEYFGGGEQQNRRKAVQSAFLQFPRLLP
ncbi:MAG: DUF5104 domain-containing protein [Oscillospiraceae bacterium]|nr:DUF5104 domain-containing protein [Oscillospiraceae bacterium]